jgi:hypothetical protein
VLNRLVLVAARLRLEAVVERIRRPNSRRVLSRRIVIPATTGRSRTEEVAVAERLLPNSPKHLASINLAFPLTQIRDGFGAADW